MMCFPPFLFPKDKFPNLVEYFLYCPVLKRSLPASVLTWSNSDFKVVLQKSTITAVSVMLTSPQENYCQKNILDIEMVLNCHLTIEKSLQIN